MKKCLSAVFACCSLFAMLGATGLRLVQARTSRENESQPAILEAEAEPKIHLFRHDHLIEWADGAGAGDS